MTDQELLKIIAERQTSRDGVQGIYVWVSGRDCDMSSYGYTSFWPGIDTVEKYETECNDWYQGSDGCEGYTIMTPEDAETAESYSRDLALEAYEDGHAHIVSEVRFETW